jgi:hypothetical protein
MSLYFSAPPNAPLDPRQFLTQLCRVDAHNLLNSLDVFHFLRVDAKMRWDPVGKPTRLNQDNQREDDLKRLREICSYLIRCKLTADYHQPKSKKSPVVSAFIAAALSSTPTATGWSLNAPQQQLQHAQLQHQQYQQQQQQYGAFHPGGLYCRVENEWKSRLSF